MQIITRKLEIDAGHRVVGHESKCKHVHGHRYVFELSCVQAAGGLDDIGRVIDFSVVKAEVGSWLDRNLDHAYVHHHQDTIGDLLRSEGHKTYDMPKDLGNPTAENLAALVWRVASRLLAPHGINMVRVRCYETPNCWADYSG